MGFLSNLFKKLFKEEVKVATPITVPITKAHKPSPSRSIKAFRNLTGAERQVIAQTIETLSDKPEDISVICDMPTRQAEYVAKAYLIDKKWANVLPLSQFVTSNDVRMLYYLYLQCKDAELVAEFFGINCPLAKLYFDKMDVKDKKQAEVFTKFPDNKRGRSHADFLSSLTNEQLENMLLIFRKAKRISAIRYVLPMYADMASANLNRKLELLWKHAVEEEKKRADEQHK